MPNQFELQFKVRDYECDLQGIVNNSVYQSYLEHTRHEFLLTKGICFSSLAKEGVHLVVTKIELHYKKPLQSKDDFIVTLNVKPKGKVRVEFTQTIIRISDKALMLKARVECVALNAQGQPFVYTEFNNLIEGGE